MSTTNPNIASRLAIALAAIGAQQPITNLIDGFKPTPITATFIGLGSVNNTADSQKPVSGPQALAIGQAVTDANGYTDSKATETLASANGYTDTTATSTLNSANAYTDAAVTSASSYRGEWTYVVEGDLFPSTLGRGVGGAPTRGDTYVSTSTYDIGDGRLVTPGDLLLAKTDVPGQTAANWTIIDSTIGYVQEDAANKVSEVVIGTNDTSTTLYPSNAAMSSFVNENFGSLANVETLMGLVETLISRVSVAENAILQLQGIVSVTATFTGVADESGFMFDLTPVVAGNAYTVGQRIYAADASGNVKLVGYIYSVDAVGAVLAVVYVGGRGTIDNATFTNIYAVRSNPADAIVNSVSTDGVLTPIVEYPGQGYVIGQLVKFPDPTSGFEFYNLQVATVDSYGGILTVSNTGDVTNHDYSAANRFMGLTDAVIVRGEFSM